MADSRTRDPHRTGCPPAPLRPRPVILPAAFPRFGRCAHGLWPRNGQRPPAGQTGRVRHMIRPLRITPAAQRAAFAHCVDTALTRTLSTWPPGAAARPLHETKQQGPVRHGHVPMPATRHLCKDDRSPAMPAHLVNQPYPTALASSTPNKPSPFDQSPPGGEHRAPVRMRCLLCTKIPRILEHDDTLLAASSKKPRSKRLHLLSNPQSGHVPAAQDPKPELAATITETKPIQFAERR